MDGDGSSLRGDVDRWFSRGGDDQGSEARDRLMVAHPSGKMVWVAFDGGVNLGPEKLNKNDTGFLFDH